MDNDFQNFVKETKFCDFSNKEIKKLADKLAENCKDDREFAISAFYWVRDNILYRVGLWQRKASETLKEKKGTCTNKANLLVALLRARNISAGYGIMKVHGQRYFGPVIIPMLQSGVAKISTHIFCCIYISGKWVKVDPADDKELSDKTSYFNEPSELVEWDGKTDALQKIDPDHIIKTNYPIANIDEIMEKKPRNAKGIVLKTANLYIDFLRKNTNKIKSIKELELLFKKWFREKYFIYFLMFHIVIFYRQIKLVFKNEKIS
jgi:hypothetical protein